MIKQLGASDIRIVSTAGGPPPAFQAMIEKLGGKFIFADSLLQIVPALGRTAIVAPLGDVPPPGPHPVALQVWLEEIVFRAGDHAVSRHELFKWAANKDGGAHVDLNLPAAYRAYSRPGAIGSVSVGGQTFPLEDAQLVALRQLGWEVLSSPETVALAT